MAQLGFMLTRSLNNSSGSRSFFFLARKALEKGHTVRAFFCFDGVFQCLKEQKPLLCNVSNQQDWLDSLLFNGAEIIVSHACLDSRGLNIEDLCPGVRMGTLEELNRIVGQSDRMVCL